MQLWYFIILVIGALIIGGGKPQLREWEISLFLTIYVVKL